MSAAGGALQYTLSLQVYRAPLSKMAQAATLREELQNCSAFTQSSQAK